MPRGSECICDQLVDRSLAIDAAANRLRALRIPLSVVVEAVMRSNRNVGGECRVVMGPAIISSENGLLQALVFMNVRGRDLGGFVEQAKWVVAQQVGLPQGYFARHRRHGDLYAPRP